MEDLSKPPAAFVRIWFETPNAGLISSLVSVAEEHTTLDLVKKVRSVCTRRDLGSIKGNDESQRFLLCMPAKSYALFTFPSNMMLWKAAKRGLVDTMKISNEREVPLCVGFLMDSHTIITNNPNYEDNAKTAAAVKVPEEYRDVLSQMFELNNKETEPNVLQRVASGVDLAASGEFLSGSLSSVPATPRTTNERRSNNGNSPPEEKVSAKTATPSPDVSAAPLPATIDRVSTSSHPEKSHPTPSPAAAAPAPKLVSARPSMPLHESLDSATIPIPTPSMGAFGVDGLLEVALRVQVPSRPPRIVTLSTTVHHYRGDFAQEVIHAALLRFRAEVLAASSTSGVYQNEDASAVLGAIRADPSVLMLAVSNEMSLGVNSSSSSDFDDVLMFTADDPVPVLSSAAGREVPKARLVMAPASVRRARNTAASSFPPTQFMPSPSQIASVLKVIPSVQDDPSIDYQNRAQRCEELERQLANLADQLDAEERDNENLERELVGLEDEKKIASELAEDGRAATRDIERLENLKSWLEREYQDRLESEKALRGRLYGIYPEGDNDTYRPSDEYAY